MTGDGHVDSPVKGTGKDEVVVGGELAQAGLEFTLVDQATGLVNYDEGEDGPGRLLAAHSLCEVVGAHMMARSRVSGVQGGRVGVIID